MNPVRVVIGFQNQIFRTVQLTGILPAAALFPAEEGPEDSLVPQPVIHGFCALFSQHRHRGVLLIEVNILLLLDQVLHHPGGHGVAALGGGEVPLRGVDGVVRADIVRELGGLGLHPPLGGLRGICFVVVESCIQSAGGKSLQSGHASHVGVQVIVLPLVNGHRQPVRGLLVDRQQHPFLCSHGNSSFILWASVPPPGAGG